MKRLFDIVAVLIALFFLFPLFLFIAIWIVVDSKGGAFYIQKRVGKENIDFGLFKFRTMKTDADKQGKITIGAKDSRITNAGYILRKYKLDELPQLLNILSGEMSIVGPRPEVREYVNLYNEEQLKVLTVKPGLTDYASLMYANENEVLGKSPNPHKTYVEEIMPHKLKLNLKYIKNKGFFVDLKLIFQTIKKVFIGGDENLIR